MKIRALFSQMPGYMKKSSVFDVTHWILHVYFFA